MRTIQIVRITIEAPVHQLVLASTCLYGRSAECCTQVVMPYRCDDLDCQHLRLMGDLGQACLWPVFPQNKHDPCCAVRERELD